MILFEGLSIWLLDSFFKKDAIHSCFCCDQHWLDNVSTFSEHRVLLDYHERWWFVTNCFCCYKTSDFIFHFYFFPRTCLKIKLKRSPLEPQKKSDLKIVTLKINDENRTGLKSAFFFLWCVTKLLEFEFELGIESFQKIIDSRCYKKTLNRKYFLKMDKTKTALDEQETSAATIKNFDTMYHFER